MPSHHDIVVIGGSSGAIEALLRILPDLPVGLPAAIFIAAGVRGAPATNRHPPGEGGASRLCAGASQGCRGSASTRGVLRDFLAKSREIVRKANGASRRPRKSRR